ncbi:MAG: DUF3592 domain-containing protein [Acidobacteriota bacterium]
MRKASKVRPSGPHGCIVAGFFGVFALGGLVATYFLAWKPLSSIVAAQSWTETECVIVSSQVATHRGSENYTYSIDIRYTYEVDWQTFHGDRYQFSIGSSSGYAGKARVVEAHPPGSETPCYYDPKNPERSVINRKPGIYLLWSLFPLPFLLVGFGGLAAVAFGWPASDDNRKAKRSRGGRWRENRSRGRRAQASPLHAHRTAESYSGARRYASATPGGTLELETQASPTTKVIGTLVIAIFWNAIVSTFLFSIFGEVSGEGFSWFAALFLIPFVLIGIGLILLFFYMVLAWFNPRPRLILVDGHLTPGCKTTLRWQFQGRAERLRQLTIGIEGREKARYRRGTDTHTDTHMFYSQKLVETHHFGEIHRGHVELTLPERTMPTFDAPNNDIEWRLTVKGDIPWWPDVDDGFSIVVYPA